MEKGDCAVPAPAESDRRRPGDASRLLAAYWLRSGEFFPVVRRGRALSGVFLPWHARAHPALHLDILHDIIEDRQAGFLQSVLVAPVRRSAITLGKILGGSSLALVQALIFLALAPTVGIGLTLAKVALLCGILFLIAFGLSSVGYFIAWKMDSTQGFHAIMNLFLMPMWLLSGSFFPASGAPGWLRWLVHANPLTYGIAAVRRALYLGQVQSAADMPPFGLCLAVTALFAALAFVATTVVASQPGR